VDILLLCTAGRTTLETALVACILFTVNKFTVRMRRERKKVRHGNMTNALLPAQYKIYSQCAESVSRQHTESLALENACSSNKFWVLSVDRMQDHICRAIYITASAWPSVFKLFSRRETVHTVTVV